MSHPFSNQMLIRFCVELVKFFLGDPVVVFTAPAPTMLWLAPTSPQITPSSPTDLSTTVVSPMSAPRPTKFSLESFTPDLFMKGFLVSMIDGLARGVNSFNIGLIRNHSGRSCPKMLGDRVRLHLVVEDILVEGCVGLEGTVQPSNIP